MRPTTRFAVAVATIATLGLGWPDANAEEQIVAKVNGKVLTEADMRLAESEIGSDLGTLSGPQRRYVLVEYLIENQLFADAAENQKLGTGSAFDERMAYWKRRALRDAYFESAVKSSVGEAAAKTYYDDQIKNMKPAEEVQARHILVDSEDKAKEIAEKLKGGGDFAQLAKEFSKDPGSKDDGGNLGFFSRGQMVPQFEDAVFKLQPGEISAPVKSKFGWHVIKLETRRDKKPPSFEEVKDRLLNAMIQSKAKSVATDLHEKAKIEYVDAEVLKQIEEQKKQQDAQRAAFEAQIKALEAKQKAGEGAEKKEGEKK